MTNPRRIGYIRVSTKTQAPDRQIEALQAECDELNIEYVSAVADARPVFDNVITSLQPGDNFVVMDLDRAFRSSIDAILTAEHLRQINVTFRILSMAIDPRANSTTPSSRATRSSSGGSYPSARKKGWPPPEPVV
jgi:DNA invertase Pin-like site-specific DNA recombinase